MKLKLVKFDGFDDWYLIERAEHNNLRYEQKIINPNGINLIVYCKDSRICGESYGQCIGVSADIEGTAEHMRTIASAIEGRYDDFKKRCSVHFKNGKAYFGSPRNDNGYQDEVSLEDADDLAKQIRDLLG